MSNLITTYDKKLITQEVQKDICNKFIDQLVKMALKQIDEDAAQDKTCSTR